LANPQAQNPYQQILRDDAASAIEQIAAAMSNSGKGTLVVISGYRSFSEQEALYQRTIENQGLDVAEQLVARAGFSEHQTGLAADVSAMGQGCEISVCFGQTEAGIWLIRNAHRFGLIVRYPEDKETITGYQYEPWHLRFVGLELASEMKERGTQTLEEFWNLEAATNYLD
jgi:D-alanyl-D-alanine carboxypeptidase